MYMWSNLTTVIPDMALCHIVKIDKTNIDSLYYFILLRIIRLAFPQKKVPAEGVSKLYRRGSRNCIFVLCKNLESVAAQRFQGFTFL